MTQEFQCLVGSTMFNLHLDSLSNPNKIQWISWNLHMMCQDLASTLRFENVIEASRSGVTSAAASGNLGNIKDPSRAAECHQVTRHTLWLCRSYWKWPLSSWTYPLNMVNFHSSVSFTRGYLWWTNMLLALSCWCLVHTNMGNMRKRWKTHLL